MTEASRSRGRDLGAIAVLLAVGLAIRLLLHAIYHPIIFPDSSSYYGLAFQILHFDFREYLGYRTPGYPLLILLAWMNIRALWILQSCLGLATSLMLFRIAVATTGSTAWALALGLLGSLAPNLLLFEAAMMTETLSVFLVTAASLLFWRLVSSDVPHAREALLLGFAVGYAVLTRPALLCLIVVYAALALLPRPRRPLRFRQRLTAAVWVALPGTFLVLGWSAFNQARVGYFGPSIVTGFNLTLHCRAYVEEAPDEFATIRDVYVSHRNLRPGGHQVIWEAVPDLVRATGMTHAKLGHELTRMSLALFRAHPTRFAESVARGWLLFWVPRHYWVYEEGVSPSADEWTFEVLPSRSTQRAVYGALAAGAWSVRLLFFGSTLAFVLMPSMRPPGAAGQLVLSVILVAGACSLFSAVLTYGENFRYVVPFHPLLMTVSVIACQRATDRRRRRGTLPFSGSLPQS